jgi:hypothetical protein
VHTSNFRCSGLIGILQPPSLELTQRDWVQFPAFDATLLSPLADIINDQSGILPADCAALLPIAADVALVPFTLFLGVGPTTAAIEGTLLNIANLIP